jgi:uncharacterized RDD family membrane protein YckC
MTSQVESPMAPAAWWRRAAAVLIDGAMLMAVSFFLRDSVGPQSTLQRGDGFIPWMIVLGGLYSSALTGVLGQTVGKVITGVRVTRPDGTRIGFGRAFARWLITGALWMFGVWVGGLIDSIAALLDRQGRTLHDRVADTIVIRARQWA